MRLLARPVSVRYAAVQFQLSARTRTPCGVYPFGCIWPLTVRCEAAVTVFGQWWWIIATPTTASEWSFPRVRPGRWHWSAKVGGCGGFLRADQVRQGGSSGPVLLRRNIVSSAEKGRNRSCLKVMMNNSPSESDAQLLSAKTPVYPMHVNILVS